MPLHQSYDVNSAEGGSTPARWYNTNCVLPLIGFFVCGALILAVCLISLPSSDSHHGNGTKSQNDRVEGAGKLYGERILPSTDDAGESPTSMSTEIQHDVTTEIIPNTKNDAEDDVDYVAGINTNGSDTSHQPYKQGSENGNANTNDVPATNAPITTSTRLPPLPPMGNSDEVETAVVPTPSAPAIASATEETTTGTTEPPVKDSKEVGTTVVPTPSAPAIASATEEKTTGTTEPPVKDSKEVGTTVVPTPSAPAIASATEEKTTGTTEPPVKDSKEVETTVVPTPSAPAIASATEETTTGTTEPPVKDSKEVGTTVVPTPSAPAIASATEEKTTGTTEPPVKDSKEVGTTIVPAPPARGIAPATEEKVTVTKSTGPTKLTSETQTDNASAELDKERVNLGSKIASRMLYHMNHLADECEDFYEYACGEFEANKLVPEKDLAKLAIKRIFDQYNKSDEREVYNTQFFRYYDSCVDAYTDNPNTSYQERIELAKSAIKEVGSFYDETEWNETYFDLTTMLSELLHRGSAPLFDITVGVAVNPQGRCTDEKSQPKYTLMLGPPVIKNSVYVDEKEDKCNKAQSSEILKESVNLKSLYSQHEKCTNKLEDFLDSVGEASEKLGVPRNIMASSRFDIEDLLSKLLPEKYQTQKIINEAYVTRNYEVMQIAKLQNDTVPESFLNWTLLLEKLTNSTVVSQQSLQVYFSSDIIKGLNNLYRDRENVAGITHRALHNALLGLYAHKVYQEFVGPQRDVEKYCKRMATDLMGTHASKLYMSSFSPDELGEMKETVNKTFEELKSALESSVEKATWLTNSDVMIRKIRDLEIEIPDESYYQDGGKLDPENTNIQHKLSGNFFEDSMMLLRRNRRLMYEMLREDPNEYAQIWTHFAAPYQTSGSAVYELNKVIMPYAAIYWPQVLEANKISSRHVVLATLGTRIANLMADHFGPTGIQYLNRMKSVRPAVFCDDANPDEAYQSYLDRYDGFVKETAGWMKLPNKQNVSYEISSLSRDQRLSDITGLQLAYDAMVALPLDSKQLMPWLNGRLDNNEATQFLMAYTQMHCTKVPLSSTFVRLSEDEHLPSRLRIALVASGSSMFGSTWKCPAGSKIRPSEGNSSYSFPQAANEDVDLE